APRLRRHTRASHSAVSSTPFAHSLPISFLSIMPPLPRSTLFPYTTLFRSAIIPWNAPVFLFAQKAAPALATGCTVVMKPSEYARSEEHTSELQSHLNLVCRLLLEKKK